MAELVRDPVVHFQGVLRAFEAGSDLDRAEILQLCQDTSEETVMRILARFRETLEESRQQSQSGLERGEPSKIWQACHKIAGSSELLGFKPFGKQSRRLSYALRENEDIAVFRADIERFLEEASSLSKKIVQSCPDLKVYLA